MGSGDACGGWLEPAPNLWEGSNMTRSARALATRRRWFLCASLVVLALAAASASEHWPQFRGLHAGVAPDDPALPDTWSATENVRWKIDVPGIAWSSPIVWDDYIFITSVMSGEKRPEPGQDVIDDVKTVSYKGGINSAKPLNSPYHFMLYAIDFKTGKIRWERELHTGVPLDPKHPKNSYASETPVTDGQRVYVYIGGIALFAVDFHGKLLWTRPIRLPAVSADVTTTKNPSTGNPRETLAPGFLSGFGWGASPVLYKDRIFIKADHEARQWYVAAFDTRNGEEVWRVSQAKPVTAYGWSTPFIWQNDLRAELITAGDLSVRSYNPLDGRLLWELKGLSINSTPTPFAANGLLYAASGYPGDTLRPVYAIRPGASGDISLKEGETSNQYIAWYNRTLAPYMASSLVYGDYHYSLFVTGFLLCNNAKTGERMYGRQRISMEATDFTSSPWAYNGKIFALAEEGDTYVIEAGPAFKVVGKNSLGEMVLATPAVVRGSLIVRTVSSLWRIAKPESRSADR
jgi:outer membrane protein assembly factor BamB